MSPVKVGGSTVYKGKSGQWSFVAHRTTGFLVFFFLLMHIVDVSLARFDSDGRLYDEVHELYGNIFMRLFEVGLLFALWFHALNGLRIIIVFTRSRSFESIACLSCAVSSRASTCAFSFGQLANPYCRAIWNCASVTDFAPPLLSRSLA